MHNYYIWFMICGVATNILKILKSISVNLLCVMTFSTFQIVNLLLDIQSERKYESKQCTCDFY